MKNQAAKPGPGAMALVAIEQAFPEGKRIVTDDLALKILPRVFMSYAWLMQRLRYWMDSAIFS